MKNFLKNRILVFCISLVLLLLVAGISSQWSENSNPVYFVVSSEDSNEEIKTWENDNVVYAFLPGYADLSHVKIKKHASTIVAIAGNPVLEDASLSNLEFNTPYQIEYQGGGKAYRKELVFVQSSCIPAVYIDTASGSMKNIHSKKGNKESGEMRLYAQDGGLEYKGSLEKISGRGNSTWEFYEKKPYSIKLSSEADLLGMGAAQEWILLANAGDASHLRNKIVYDFSDVFGLKYSPKAQWVDLYLNGEYHGLYLLCERNEIHPSRVDISVEKGFLVSQELRERLDGYGDPYISTQMNQTLRIHHLLATDAALNELSSKWQSVENAIIAGDNTDSVLGKNLLELIDIDSWVQKYLIEEVFGNYDACSISQYYYGERNADSGIVAGPVWDYDSAMGCKTSWQLSTPNALFADRLHVKTGYDTPWFYALCRKDEFRSRMLELYQAEFLPLLDELLNEKIDAYVQQIRASADANGIRWSQETEIVSEAEYIKQYMIARREFLNSIWLKGETYHQVRADSTHGDNYGYYFVRSGECLTELHAFENNESQEFIGWYYTDTDVPFDASLPIHEDISIYAKWQDTSEHKLNQILKLIPLGIIAVLLTIFVIAEIRRNMRRK